MLILLFVSIAFHSSPLLGDADTIESADSATMVAESAVKPDVSTSGDEDQTEVVADLEQPWSLPDITHRYFSKNIEGLSDAVDSIFGDDRIFEETSRTYVQLRGSVIFAKTGEVTFDSRIRARVRLDNLSDRFHILLSGEEDPADPGTIVSGGELDSTINDLDPAASLQYVLLEKQRWDVRLQPGVKFRAPVDLFFKVRLRRQHPFKKRWLWRTTLAPVWYDSRGYEFPVSVDFERGTGGGGLFRSSSSGVWREEDSTNLYLQESLLFTHPLGSLNQLAYTAGVGFEREPHWRDTLYFATVRFRRNIYHGWVFFEVTPQVLFARSSDFKAEPSLAITLELLFGSAYL